MNGATFRATRERLGLTTRWVSEELDVRERTVHRWESGASPIPEGVVDALDSWEELHDWHVEQAGDPVVVPFKGEHDGYPASWWRAIAAEARREQGSGIEYEGA